MGTATEKKIELEHGRTIAVSAGETGETVEIRAESGAVELRVRMTPQGPVVLLEGVKIEIKASDSIEMECRKFSVNASEEVALESAGALDIKSTGEMNIKSADECIVRGKMIRLN